MYALSPKSNSAVRARMRACRGEGCVLQRRGGRHFRLDLVKGARPTRIACHVTLQCFLLRLFGRCFLPGFPVRQPLQVGCKAFVGGVECCYFVLEFLIDFCNIRHVAISVCERHPCLARGGGVGIERAAAPWNVARLSARFRFHDDECARAIARAVGGYDVGQQMGHQMGHSTPVPRDKLQVAELRGFCVVRNVLTCGAYACVSTAD